MKEKSGQTRGKRSKRPGLVIPLMAIVLIALIITAGVLLFWRTRTNAVKPQDILTEYMDHVPKGEYEEMYAMLDPEESGDISQEDFIKRNSGIYEGIEIQNMKIQILEDSEGKKDPLLVKYRTSFDTVAGNLSFESEAHFVKSEEGYKLAWDDSLIFPELTETDKIRVSTIQAERGSILDRNDRVLAGKGTASSVGIVPGKLEDREGAIQAIAELLEMTPEAIENQLGAQWVDDESFVPIKTIPKINELEVTALEPDEAVLKEQERQEALLAIPGVMISDVEVRQYPLGEAAAHLVGYVQNVTAEDLEEHAGEGYNSNSVIGRSGIEGLFEKKLKGTNGYDIYIEDENGDRKAGLASVSVVDGENIKLTIDASIQSALYEQFQTDKSCSVAMNPYTGEVLALVSTPSYNNNEFIMGMSDERWTALNEDEQKPLYNRFRQVWCPGSTFKPIIAAIGLKSGAIDPAEDYGSEGLSWQKDESWGDYHVTTLHTYSPVTLENALIYSDNIYFAKAALKIGSEELENSLNALGFGEEIPFDIKMSVSQYSNEKHIDAEVQLADSGYGQGQVLVNPLHLACLYTSFANQGNVVKPYLVYRDQPRSEIWLENVIPEDAANTVLEGLKKVINDPNGTGYAAHRDDAVLAGKTGTAEIKASQDDTTGTELGWFAVFTGQDTAKQVLIVNMVEDVKDRGGSGYVVGKDKVVLDTYLSEQ